MTSSKRAKSIGAGSLGVSALGLAAVSLAVSVGPLGAASDSSAPTAPVSAGEYSETLKVMTQVQQEDDLLPEWLASRAQDWGESGISTVNTRLLGSDEAGKYWAAVDNSGNVCVVVATSEKGFASACQPVERFEKYGVDVRYQQPTLGTFSEVYLIPDGVDLSSPPKGLHSVGKNLLSGDTRRTASMGEAVEVSGERARFELHLIGPEPKD